MNLNDIQANEDLVKWWSKVVNHANFRDGIMKMLNDTHPLRFVDTSPVTTASSDKRLGTIEGYELALERIRLCSQYQPKLGDLPPPSFSPPEIEQPN
jgi:hypothetical protein